MDKDKDLTIREDIDVCLEKTLNQNHSNLALLLKYLYFNTVRFNGKFWYHFKNHRWQVSENTPLEDIVKNNLVNKYLDLANTYNGLVIKYQQMMETDLGDLECIPYELTINDLIYKSKLCSELCLELNNHSFVQKILAVAEHVFLQKDFEYLIDLQPQLLGFNNGVYDLDQKKLKIGHPEDLISMNVGYDFQEGHKGVEKKEIIQHLDHLFGGQEGRSDFLKEIRQMLHGEQRYPVIQVYGLDNSGIQFLETLLSKCLGDYLGRLPLRLLSKKKFSHKETNSELVDNCKKRICLMSQGFETISNEDFNLDMMDQLLVETSLHIRKAYDKLNDYRPQFGLVVLSDLLEVEPQPGMLTFKGCKLDILETDQDDVCIPDLELEGGDIMKLLIA